MRGTHLLCLFRSVKLCRRAHPMAASLRTAPDFGPPAASASAAASDGTKAPAPQLSALDRSAFDSVIDVPALRVPKRACHTVSKRLKRFLLRQRRVVPVVRDEADPDNSRLILLYCPFVDLPADVAAFARSQGATEASELHSVKLSYQHLSADTVLRRILPSNVEVPGAFEVIGHIGESLSLYLPLRSRLCCSLLST